MLLDAVEELLPRVQLHVEVWRPRRGNLIGHTHTMQLLRLLLGDLCVCAVGVLTYLLEFGVLGNLHQLHLHLLGLDRERLFDVLCGAAVQRHRDDLDHDTKTNNFSVCYVIILWPYFTLY